jgi:hypothetical protein
VSSSNAYNISGSIDHQGSGDATLPCGDIDYVPGTSPPDLSASWYDPTVLKYFLLGITWDGTGISDTAGNTYTAIPGASDGPVTCWLAPYDNQLNSGDIFTGGATCKGLQVIAFLGHPLTPLAGIDVKSSSFTGPPSFPPGSSGYFEEHRTDHVDLPADFYVGDAFVIAIERGLDNVDGSDPDMTVRGVFGIGTGPNDWDAATTSISPPPTDLGRYCGTNFFTNSSFGGGAPHQPIFLSDSHGDGLALHSTGYAQGIMLFGRSNTQQTVDWALVCVVTSVTLIGGGGGHPPPPDATPSDGVDLAFSTKGLHVAYRTDAEVRHRLLRWGQTDWDAYTVVATDADATFDHGACPCIMVDSWDRVYIWYHDTTPDTHGYRSQDSGQTWELYCTHAATTYPKLAWAEGLTVVAQFIAVDELIVLRSTDFGKTELADEPLKSFGTQQIQRPCLGVDKSGRVHLVLYDGASLVHYSTRAVGLDSAWEGPTTLHTGKVAGYAIGFRRALLVWFEGTDLKVGLLGSDYAGFDQVVTSPVASFEPIYPGVAYDKWDRPWLMERSDDDAHGNPRLTFRSPDGAGITWADVGSGGGIGP